MRDFGCYLFAQSWLKSPCTKIYSAGRPMEPMKLAAKTMKAVCRKVYRFRFDDGNEHKAEG